MPRKSKTISPLQSVLLSLLIVLSSLSLDGCAQSIQKTKSDNAETMTSEDASDLKGRKERLSYGLGMVLGNQFRKQSVEVDPDVYARGLKDGLAGGETLMTNEDAQAQVNMLKKALNKKRAAPPTVDSATEIKASFKLDPRLTRGQYMGNRWISPPTFASTYTEGTDLIVEAQVQGLDPHGRSIVINPEWIPADPDMVTTTPSQGNTVKIIVKRPGQSSLKIVSEKVTKELLIKATDSGKTRKVEITQ